MADKKKGWRQLSRTSLSSKALSRRAKRVEGATIRHARKFIVHRLDNMREVRRHIIAWLVLMGLLIGLVGAQLLWFQRSYQTTAPTSGGTYAEATYGAIDTLNPLFATTASETAVSHLLFSSLYDYDKTGALGADLAESIEVDDTQTTYTVTLRPNVLWHDGAKLTARDVAYTVNLIKDPNTRSPLRINWQDVSVKALDDRRVQFVLPAVYAAFPHALTFAVLPAHILRDVSSASVRESTYSRSPIGSGPFRLQLLQTASDRHKIVQMAAFDQYYKGRVLLDRFEIHGYETNEQIINALRTGQVTAASDIAPGDLASVPKHSYRVMTHPINSVVYSIFNTTRPALSDKTVRQALRHSIDTKLVRKEAAPNAPAADLPILPGQVAEEDLPIVPGYDMREAGRLLDQAGWKLEGDTRKKDGKELTIDVATIKDPQYEKVLEVVSASWRKLGIKVNPAIFNTSDPSVNFVRETLQPRNYDVLIYELSIGGDPDVYAYWHSSQIGQRGYNFANYTNSIGDDALSSARLTLDPQLRSLKYKSFMEQWEDSVPAVGLYQPVTNYVHSKNIIATEDTMRLVTPYSRYANIQYWSTEQSRVYKTP